MDAMKIANSIPMWLACALPVAFVISGSLIRKGCLQIRKETRT